MDIFIAIIEIIIILGLLISLHEAGHLSMAKAFHVYCFEYSIGFGPALLHKKRKNGETYFSLRAIPLGGYVSMYGETGETPDGYEAPDPSRSLNAIAKWKKAIVLVAGVFLNFVLGLVLIFISNIAFPQYYASYAYQPVGSSQTIFYSEATYSEQVLSYIEEEAEERKRKLQREEAERSKALAIFQATIDTLASVVGFMSDPGGWAGIAMSAMAAATGAAQIAAIAAEPLPSYAVGAVDINEDQIAQLHQGELVVPKTFAEGIRDGDISIGGSESKVEVTIINNTGAAATADRFDDGDITRLRITIGETIASEISSGRLDSAMTRRFNITRRNQRG